MAGLCPLHICGRPVRSRATGPGAKIPGEICMHDYVCSEIKKLAFKVKTWKTEKLKTHKNVNWKPVLWSQTFREQAVACHPSSYPFWWCSKECKSTTAPICQCADCFSTQPCLSDISFECVRILPWIFHTVPEMVLKLCLVSFSEGSMVQKYA